MRIIQLKEQLLITCEEDAEIGFSFVDHLHVSDIIDSRDEDPDSDDLSQVYHRTLTIDTPGGRLTITLTADAPEELALNTGEPPKRPVRKREMLPTWLYPGKTTQGK